MSVTVARPMCLTSFSDAGAPTTFDWRRWHPRTSCGRGKVSAGLSKQSSSLLARGPRLAARLKMAAIAWITKVFLIGRIRGCASGCGCSNRCQSTWRLSRMHGSPGGPRKGSVGARRDRGISRRGRDLHRRGDHPGLLMLPVSVEFIAQCAREPVIGKHPGVKSLDAVDACGDRQRTQQHRPEPAALIGVRHS